MAYFMSFILRMSKSIIRTAMKIGVVDVAKHHAKQIVKRESETVKLYARYTLLRNKLKKYHAKLGKWAYPYILRGENIPVTSEMKEYIQPAKNLLAEMDVIRRRIKQVKEEKKRAQKSSNSSAQ